MVTITIGTAKVVGDIQVTFDINQVFDKMAAALWPIKLSKVKLYIGNCKH